MNISPRKRRTPNQWQALVNQWQQSDLSALGFCKQNQVGYASFCQWRKRLEQDPLPVSDAAAESRNFIDLGTLPTERVSRQNDHLLTFNLCIGRWLNLVIQA